ncbi:MAG: endolytic transglycosylase MltG [Marinobacter sp.]|nr:endolytic transglycosylase MltG [Marinobacter sp.]
MIKSLLVALFCVFILAVSGTGLWAWQGLQQLDQAPTLDNAVLFDVEPGMPFVHVARLMEARGLVKDSFWLRLKGRLNPQTTQIKAGQYEFKPGMTTNEMVAKMIAGDTKTWSIRFIEGWRFQELRDELARQPQLKQTITGQTDAQIMTRLDAEGVYPEGWFFPDTYLFQAGDSDLDILRRAYQKMQSVLAREWDNRAKDLPYDSPYDALIMASIVERETGAAHEREQVAGVFVRRLKRGMRLQTDPTVIYGMGDAYDGGLSRKDLKTPTPYNTYRISGLPPTPIAMPGDGAIHAALHPAAGNALYFVARGDGTHKFSSTLAEHQKAVRAFQLRRRDDYRSSPPPAEEADKP